MKRELRDAWSKALRSDEYAQTSGALGRTEEDRGRPVGYCCLGVLCKVAGFVEVHRDGVIEFRTLNGDLLAGTLGHGLDEFNLTPAIQNNFIRMNDEQRCTFEQIADAVDKLSCDDDPEPSA